MSDAPASPSKLRWILGWIVAPLALVGALFLAGVHLGARRPDKPIARLLLWMFDARAGVGQSWTLEEFEFGLTIPAGAWREQERKSHGLSFRLEDPAVTPGLPTRLSVYTTCGGSCRPDEYEDRVRELIPNRQFEQYGKRLERMQWIVRPSELRDGVWWWHYSGWDRERDLTVHYAAVVYLLPDAEHVLFCNIEGGAEPEPRVEALIELCAGLDVRVVDKS